MGTTRRTCSDRPHKAVPPARLRDGRDWPHLTSSLFRRRSLHVFTEDLRGHCAGDPEGTRDAVSANRQCYVAIKELSNAPWINIASNTGTWPRIRFNNSGVKVRLRYRPLHPYI